MLKMTQAENELTGQFISSDDLLKAVMHLRDEEQLKAVIRCWISEGQPFLFSSNPLSFERVRTYIAGEFGIAPRDVSLIGSARLGYSADPNHYSRPLRLGRNRASSDLDLAFVNKTLFEDCRKAFEAWDHDLKAGLATPKSFDQGDSVLRLPKNIRRGFIDPHKIPHKYGNISSILGRLNRLNARMNSNGYPLTREASVRVYQDWVAFDTQNLLNLKALRGLAMARIAELNSRSASSQL